MLDFVGRTLLYKGSEWVVTEDIRNESPPYMKKEFKRKLLHKERPHVICFTKDKEEYIRAENSLYLSENELHQYFTELDYGLFD
jgi:hypothetical protein